MEKLNQILHHEQYLSCLRQIEALEAERVFCCHGEAHALDVARIAYCMALEKQLEIPKEQIYAAALLHDIGRGEEYLRGTPHEEASVILAEKILRESGFSMEERKAILEAIGMHRRKDAAAAPMAELLATADRWSRPCYHCRAAEDCYWSEEKKNKEMKY